MPPVEASSLTSETHSPARSIIAVAGEDGNDGE